MIIPDMIPELTAYLYMIGMRYERTYRATESSNRNTSDRYLRGVRDYCEVTVEVIQRIVDTLNDKFYRHEWWVAWADICDKFGIEERIKQSCNFELEDTFSWGGGI
jgi:hypothetical protein